MSNKYTSSSKRYSLQQSFDPDLIRDYEKFIESSDEHNELEEREKIIRISKISSKRKQKLINQEREAMWDQTFFQNSMPVRQLIMIKPEPPKTKKKKDYYEDYRKQIIEEQKPWYLFNNNHQEHRRDFQTRVLRRKREPDYQSELPQPQFMAKTVNLDQKDPLTEAKLKNQYYVWSYNKKHLNHSSKYRPKRTQAPSHSHKTHSKKEIDNYKQTIPSKDVYYFSSEQKRRKLGPIAPKSVKNSQIEYQTLQNTNFETEHKKKEATNCRITHQEISLSIEPQRKSPPKSSVIKLVERKQLYTNIIEAFSFNFVPPEKQNPISEKIQMKQKFTQTKYPAQKLKTIQALLENQKKKTQPVENPKKDGNPKQDEKTRLSSPEKQKQKDTMLQEIQASNNKKVKPIYEQLLASIIEKQASPSALDVIKADLIQMQKNKKIDKQLEMEIEDREALINEMRELLSKGEQNEQNAQILVSLIEEYREATLDVVRELKEWDQENSEQYYWQDQIYVNKMGNDLVFWGEDLKEDEFDPFLMKWGQSDSMSEQLRVQIVEAQKYIKAKQQKLKQNPQI